MNIEELLGYLYGLRIEAQFKHDYYTNMYKKWAGGSQDKIDILVKAYGWICETRVLLEVFTLMLGYKNE